MNSTDNLPRALDAAQNLCAAYDRMWQALWDQQQVPRTVLEACRLRLAAMHSAEEDLRLRNALTPVTPLEENKAQAVIAGRWQKADDFSAAERAALEFTEVYAMDPGAITDEQAAAVVASLGNAGLVALIEFLGFAEGRLRLAMMFALH